VFEKPKVDTKDPKTQSIIREQDSEEWTFTQITPPVVVIPEGEKRIPISSLPKWA